jgi:hypothetical protein
MIFITKLALVKISKILLKALIISSVSFLIFNSTMVNAQYGGGTISNNSSQTILPKFTTSQSAKSTTISIESGKKNDVINIVLNNTSNNISKISFTLNSDISNGLITMSAIDNSLLFSDLPGNPLAGFKIDLGNINYDQIGNFSFDFSIKNENIDRDYLAYSSNSPWANAGISKPYAINSGQDLLFTGSTTIAFKQFALTASSKTTQGVVLGVTDTVNTTSDSVLVRTGQTGYNLSSLIILSLIFIASTYFILQSNNR